MDTTTADAQMMSAAPRTYDVTPERKAATIAKLRARLPGLIEAFKVDLRAEGFKL